MIELLKWFNLILLILSTINAVHGDYSKATYQLLLSFGLMYLLTLENKEMRLK